MPARPSPAPARGDRTAQQITILSEVARRVRDHAGLAPNETYEKPLVVVLTKCDAWSHLLGGPEAPDPWIRPGRARSVRPGVDRFQERSRALRALMLRDCPDVVAAAEGFAREVVYVAAMPWRPPTTAAGYWSTPDRGR